MTPDTIGPIHVARIELAKAGAHAEIIFANGSRFLTYRSTDTAVAEDAIAKSQQVVGTIRRSGSGNGYLDGLRLHQPTCETFVIINHLGQYLELNGQSGTFWATNARHATPFRQTDVVEVLADVLKAGIEASIAKDYYSPRVPWEV